MLKFSTPFVLPTEFVLTDKGVKRVSQLKAGDVLVGLAEEKDIAPTPSLDKIFKSVFGDEQMKAKQSYSRSLFDGMELFKKTGNPFELSRSKSVFDTLDEAFKEFEDFLEGLDNEDEEEDEAIACMCGKCPPKEQTTEEPEAIKRKPVHFRRINDGTIIVELRNGASRDDIAEFMYNAKEKYGYHISGQHGSGIVMSTNARSVTCMTKDDFKELITIFGIK